MMNLKANLKAARNEVARLAKQSYFSNLQVLWEMLRAAGEQGVVFDEDETPFALCGAEGRAFVPAVNADTGLVFVWYRMPVTGRFEVTAYLS